MKLCSARIDLTCAASRILPQLNAGPTQSKLQYTDLTRTMLESLDRYRQAGYELQILFPLSDWQLGLKDFQAWNGSRASV